MSKTKLIIPIDTATLVDAVKHTNFTQDEQREILNSLMRQCKLRCVMGCRSFTIMPWAGFVKPTIKKMVENQNFGQAIEALKQGKRVARQGWNGKGMFLFLLPAGTVPTKAIHDPALREVIEQEIGGETFEALGSIRMFTADKKILTGWLASQTDMLAEDWTILD